MPRRRGRCGGRPAAGAPRAARRVRLPAAVGIVATRPASLLPSRAGTEPAERTDAWGGPLGGLGGVLYIIPPMPPIPPYESPAPAVSCGSATIASVMRMFLPIEAAFSSAERATIVGS